MTRMQPPLFRAEASAEGPRRNRESQRKAETNEPQRPAESLFFETRNVQGLSAGPLQSP